MRPWTRHALLAATFERVVACDVSRSNLEHARVIVQQSNANNVELRLVQSPDFGM
jgi:hypothetical protein